MPTATPSDFAFDYLKRTVHWDDVMAIENTSFNENARWSDETLIRHMRRREVQGTVITQNGSVKGFMVYEINGDVLRLLDIAVSPECRGQGIGRILMENLFSKVEAQRRTFLEILLPEACAVTLPFFKKWRGSQLRIRPTSQKGTITLKLKLLAMDKSHVGQVQRIETDFFLSYPGEPRVIEHELEMGTHGIVAYDEWSDRIVGFALYERPDQKAVTINGEYGLIVRADYRRKGVGRAIMRYIQGFGYFVKLRDVNLLCKTQRAFLTAMGATVPEVEKYADVVMA